MDIKKQITKKFLLGQLFINDIKASRQDYSRLIKCINNGDDFTIDATKNKTNILIDQNTKKIVLYISIYQKIYYLKSN